ncbi:MAG: DUF2254 domain-containing protein, partial [Theionarchaea archaeon]|nr:DUF2254 domain-containing protein [Theionarchaea archaeon]
MLITNYFRRVTAYFKKYPRYFYLISPVFATISCILFSFIIRGPIDENSARNMISTLAESEAAILAIVITLSLVAVQLTASSYSSRMTDIFRKKFDLWMVMSLYIVVISFTVAVLKMIGTQPELAPTFHLEKLMAVFQIMDESMTRSEIFLCISYFFGMLCFSILIPYTYNMLILLKPSKIIKEISHDITTDRILEDEEPLQLITYIVRSSITKYDYETTKDGLEAITKKISNIIEREDIERSNIEKISKRVFNHLSRVGKYAANKEDEDSTIEVIKNIKEIGKKIVEKRYEKAVYWVGESIERTGKAAAEKGLEMAVQEASDSLGSIGEDAARAGLKMAVHYVAESLGEIGKVASEKEFGLVAQKSGESLEKIGQSAAEKGLEMAVVWVIQSLGEIGKAAAKKGLNMTVYWLAESLEKIGKDAAERQFGMAVAWSAQSLGDIGKTATEKGFERIAQWCIESLTEIG